MSTSGSISVSLEERVGVVVLDRPPHNFVDVALMSELAECFERLDAEINCRAIVLTAQGKTFCAGADFAESVGDAPPDPEAFYAQALRLFRTRKPVVAAVQGAAIGAGVGLALAADFRIASSSARFSVNFNRLGLHPGFGLSYTLPRLVGTQQASRLFYLGERIDGVRALAIGLVDELVPDEEVRWHAKFFARRIAESAPLAVQSTRETLRLGLADEIETCNRRERDLQRTQFGSNDFREGVLAAREHRIPAFNGT